MGRSRALVPAVGTAILAISMVASAASGPAAPRPPAPSRARSDDRVFYSLGVLLSRNLQSFDLSEHEYQQVLRGFNDGFRHRANVGEAQSLIPLIRTVQHQREYVAIRRRKEAGAAFLAKVAAIRGARRTSSGLVYVSLVQGTGPTPKPTDRVTVQYTGKLIDGTVFDSSLRRGEPATFPLAAIIPCWREALQLMKVGGKARVVCPSVLAYGDYGRPPAIPPGATLDFQIELLGVKPGPGSMPARPAVR